MWNREFYAHYKVSGIIGLEGVAITASGGCWEEIIIIEWCFGGEFWVEVIDYIISGND